MQGKTIKGIRTGDVSQDDTFGIPYNSLYKFCSTWAINFSKLNINIYR